MRKYIWSVLALATLSTVAMAAQHHHIAAANCQVSYSDDALVMRTVNLINWDASRTFSCPIPFTSTTSSPVTVDPASGRVDYMDASAAENVACHIEILTSTGTSVAGATRYSCATAGGCATNNPYYSVSNQYLTFVDTIGSTANVIGMTVVCNVPAFDTTYGTSSALSGVAVSTATP